MASVVSLFLKHFIHGPLLGVKLVHFSDNRSNKTLKHWMHMFQISISSFHLSPWLIVMIWRTCTLWAGKRNRRCWGKKVFSSFWFSEHNHDWSMVSARQIIMFCSLSPTAFGMLFCPIVMAIVASSYFCWLHILIYDNLFKSMRKTLQNSSRRIKEP